MLSEKLQQALNGQLNAEFYSAYLYLSMAACFENTDLPGFANWMRIQTQEEMFHAMKFYDYINERNSGITLKPIEAPPAQWDSPLAVFKATLQHEQKVTGLINGLVNLAIEEKDHAANNFLQWFVSEQVEEEKNVADMIGKLKLITGSPQALYMLDREMALRIFTPPITQGE